jgi:hypothetical protein
VPAIVDPQILQDLAAVEVLELLQLLLLVGHGVVPAEETQDRRQRRIKAAWIGLRYARPPQ